MSDRVYWLISKKSPVMKVINEALAKQQTFIAAMSALQKEFGGKDLWTWENAVFSGITFDGPIPAPWRLKKSKGYAVADVQTKEGKALRNRLEDLPRGVTPRCFSFMLFEALQIQFKHWDDNRVMWTVYEKIGDKCVLSVPAGLAIKAIAGCKELKMSEYWKLKEAA